MTDPDGEARLRKAAERRADAKLGFRTHATNYLLVNAGLLALNLVRRRRTSCGSPRRPPLGWGVGLAAHGAAVYLPGSDLRERMVAEEMERLRRGGGPRQ